MMRGLFITVEGGEGVGKTSFIKAFTKKLQLLNKIVVVTREPGGTPTADKIREIFAYPPQNDPLAPMTELLLVAAARYQHVHTFVRPNIEAGKIVVSDRFSDSTRVYQGILGGLSKEVEEVMKFAEDGLKPDLTLLLDCPLDAVIARLQSRENQNKLNLNSEKPTRYDQAHLQVHQKIRQAYLDLSKIYPDRIKLIDSSATVESSVEKAWKYLEKLL